MRNFDEPMFGASAGAFWEARDCTERGEVGKRAVSKTAQRRRGRPLARKLWIVLRRLYRLNARQTRLPLPYL